MKELKGGLDSGFKGFNIVLSNDIEQEIEKQAAHLSDSIFLCSAAWQANRDGWQEREDAIYRVSRGFSFWKDTVLQLNAELSQVSDCISRYSEQVKNDTVALIELMGQWYDDLVKRAGNKTQRWFDEYKRFAKAHKQYARRFWQYRDLLGKEVPAI